MRFRLCSAQVDGQDYVRPDVIEKAISDSITPGRYKLYAAPAESNLDARSCLSVMRTSQECLLFLLHGTPAGDLIVPATPQSAQLSKLSAKRIANALHRNRTLRCILFLTCHSSKLVQRLIRSSVDVPMIGFHGEVPLKVLEAYVEGFYSRLPDNGDLLVHDAHEAAVDLLRERKIDADKNVFTANFRRQQTNFKIRVAHRQWLSSPEEITKRLMVLKLHESHALWPRTISVDAETPRSYTQTRRLNDPYKIQPLLELIDYRPAKPQFRIILLCGCSGSGKTSLLWRLFTDERHVLPRVRLLLDFEKYDLSSPSSTDPGTSIPQQINNEVSVKWIKGSESQINAAIDVLLQQYDDIREIDRSPPLVLVDGIDSAASCRNKDELSER